jgi:ParB family chromosome partitioning protein
MNIEKKVLGRGLAALISDNQNNYTVNKDTSDPKQTLSIELIDPNPYQPRNEFKEEELNELANSITSYGILQPIIVRKVNDRYQLIAGERRLRAAKKIFLQQIPVIIKEFNDLEMLEIALIENIQRENLNILEEAAAYKKLIEEYSLTQEQVAKKIGKSRSYIANTLRLLSLPEDVKVKVLEGKLSAGHARSLIGKDNASEIANRIIKDKLTVRDIENWNKHNHNNAPFYYQTNPDLIELARSLSEALGIRISIKESQAGNVVNIYYSTLEELDTIVQRLGSERLNF